MHFPSFLRTTVGGLIELVIKVFLFFLYIKPDFIGENAKETPTMICSS